MFPNIKIRFSPSNIAIVVLAVISVVSTGSAVYFEQQYAKLKVNPQVSAEEETRSLISEVSQLMVLPDEQPTVATVTDPAKLKDQLFFANAKTGDKVLIFTGAKKAILYDPTAKKILEVAPLNVGAADSQAPVPTEPPPAPTTDNKR